MNHTDTSSKRSTRFVHMARKEDFSPATFLADMAVGGAVAEQATRLMLKALRPGLRTRFISKGVAFADIEELDAEVFSAVMHGWASVRQPGAFKAWVNAIADNVVNEHWREKMLQRRHVVGSDGPLNLAGDPEDEGGPGLSDQWLPDLTSSDPEVRRCIHRQLKAYGQQHPERMNCIELVVVVGHDVKEIAEILGRTYGATRQYMSTCFALLANFLSVCIGPDELRGRPRGQAKPEA